LEICEGLSIEFEKESNRRITLSQDNKRQPRRRQAKKRQTKRRRKRKRRDIGCDTEGAWIVQHNVLLYLLTKT
jgi:hypothetical protein